MITRIKLSTMKQDLPKYRSMLAGNPSYVPPSYESIATATGTGSSTTITFSSIPGTYKHLQIRGIMRQTGSGGGGGFSDFRIRFNSDTANNYAYHQLYADGSTVYNAGSSSAATTYFEYYALIPQNGTTANVMGVSIIDIHDYASTTKNKTLRAFNGTDNNGAGWVHLDSGVWLSTSAITSVSLIAPTGINFSTSSTFALYGIKG